MGFYIEMPQSQPQEGLFEEKGVPSAFWVLYGIALFAALCMGTAAFTVLKDLFIQGTLLDQLLLLLILLAVPLLLLVGVKLALLRKFVDFTGNHLIVGFRLPKSRNVLFRKTFPKTDIKDFFLVNKRQSANLAKREHKDQRYHIRGHWKVLAEFNGKRTVLDRHTDRESLEPLFGELKRWLGR